MTDDPEKLDRPRPTEDAGSSRVGAAEAPSGPRAAPAEPPSLRHSVRDGCAHAIMLGAGEAYLSPFAIFLGAGSLLLGLLASLPLLIGALVQMGSVYLLDRVPRRKPLVTFPALLQALSWIPLLLLPLLFRSHGPAVLLGCALLYFALGSLVVPAWNSWMGDLVSPETRGRYFGRRDRLRTIWQVVSVLASGLALSLATELDREVIGFGAIFATALIGRLLSTRELHLMDEPRYQPPAREDKFTLLDFLRRMPRSNFGRFTLFVGCMQAATFLASPFFTLYMLRDLRFSYVQFTAASTICILAQGLTFQNWGKVGDRFGNYNILRVTGFAIPVVPLLWLISPRFEAVLVYQVISGFVWAGFNLSSANFIFDAVTPPKRARCVAYYNLLLNGGILVGALGGGLIAPHLPGDLALFGLRLPLASHLQVLFLLSGIARLVVAVVFLGLIREVRTVEKPRRWDVIVQVVGLSPIRGFRFSILSGVHRRERERLEKEVGEGRGKPGEKPPEAPR